MNRLQLVFWIVNFIPPWFKADFFGLCMMGRLPRFVGRVDGIEFYELEIDLPPELMECLGTIKEIQ